jgi:heme/copper-type cytochrome/quinol oxidase subunit 4
MGTIADSDQPVTRQAEVCFALVGIVAAVFLAYISLDLLMNGAITQWVTAPPATGLGAVPPPRASAEDDDAA